MSKDKCCVPSCKYRRTRYPEIGRRSLFRCPKDPEYAQEWCDNIPGIEVLKPNDHVCDIHFEDRFIYQTRQVGTNTRRVRLYKRAVPTLFNVDPLNVRSSTDNLHLSSSSCSNYSDSLSVSTQNESIDSFEVSNIQLRDCTSKLPNIENSMQNVVKDLEASETLLMNIKKEELSLQDTVVKIETPEDVMERFNQDRNCEMEKFTVLQYVKYNRKHLTSLLPESWNIFQLSINDDDMVSFSKECTINENVGLLIMYEKNIVIYKNGNVQYSIHGKRLTEIDSDNTENFPKNIPNVKILLKIVNSFDQVKVCQGLMISDYEINSDSAVYKDDLNFKRHIKCCLITDKQQCDDCFTFNQSILKAMNKSQVLTNVPLSYVDRNCQFFYQNV